MRKITLLIVTVTLFAQYSKAQDKEVKFHDRFQIGFKIGGNYSNIYDAIGNEFDATPKFGLAIGSFITIPFDEHIGIQSEILFSKKGFYATGRIADHKYKFAHTANYLDVPLLLSLRANDLVTLHVGPLYSFLINQKDVFVDKSLSQEQMNKFKTDNNRRNILCFIGGLDFNISHLVFGVRVGWDIKNNVNSGTLTASRYKNIWYQATLGIRIL